MMAPDLAQAIQHYAAALQRLNSPTPPLPEPEVSSQASPSAETSPSPVVSSISKEAQVLEVLVARDRIQAILTTLSASPELSPPDPEDLAKLSLLDQHLREQVPAIAPFTQNDPWRNSFKPADSSWWWFLKTEENPDSLGWLWGVISLVSITASFSLIGDSVPRFLVGGPDLLGSFFVTLQSVTGLLSTGAVVKALQEASQRTISQRKLPNPWWGRVSAGLSFLFLLSSFGLRLSLPYWSEQYRHWGIENYNRGNWSSAEEDYQRALQLDPDNAEAHLRLGQLYEDMQEPDKARTQYQLAVQGNLPTAVNNLARLNILVKKDYPAAVSLLLKTLEDDQKTPLKPSTRHAVLKNLAWARLKQKNYPDAEAKLLEAIDLEATTQLDRESIADTHCLLAQVMEGLGDQKGALKKWQVCNQYANITIPEHDEWNAIAEQRLSSSEVRK